GHGGIDLGGIGKLLADNEQVDSENLAAAAIFEREEAAGEIVEAVMPVELLERAGIGAAEKVRSERNQVRESLSFERTDRAIREAVVLGGESRHVSHKVDDLPDHREILAAEEIQHGSPVATIGGPRFAHAAFFHLIEDAIEQRLTPRLVIWQAPWVADPAICAEAGI